MENNIGQAPTTFDNRLFQFCGAFDDELRQRINDSAVVTTLDTSLLQFCASFNDEW